MINIAIQKSSYLLLSVLGEIVAILAVSISDLGVSESLVVFIGGILVSTGVFLATTKVTMKNVKEDLDKQRARIDEHKKLTDDQNSRISENEKQLELLRQLINTQYENILSKIDGIGKDINKHVEVGDVKKEKYEENLQHIWKAIEKIEKKINA